MERSPRPQCSWCFLPNSKSSSGCHPTVNGLHLPGHVQENYPPAQVDMIALRLCGNVWKSAEMCGNVCADLVSVSHAHDCATCNHPDLNNTCLCYLAYHCCPPTLSHIQHDTSPLRGPI